MSEPRDARVALRLPITLRVRLSWRGGVVSCFTTNVSAAGLFVETVNEIPVDEEVNVAFAFQREGELRSVAARGTVVRRIESGESRGLVTGVGIRFDELVKGEEDLVRLISRRLWEIRASRSRQRDQDRRMHPRVEVGLPTYWGTERPPSREGFLRNLSVSGGFVMETLSPMPRGEQLHLWFELPARGAPQPVHALAKVARVVTDRRFELLGLGVEFEVSSDDRSLIEHFVTQRLEWERSLADAPADGLVP